MVNYMKISQMLQIIRVYECGSINKAAEQLYMSQSSLSSSVRAVESELGIHVFKRTRNGVELTPDGKEFVDTARDIVKEYETMLSRISRKPESRLFIASQYLRYANIVFAEVSEEIAEKGASLRFLEMPSNDVCKEVSTKNADIGIIVTPTKSRSELVRILSGMGLEGRLVCVDESRCIIGRKNPLYDTSSDYVSLKQLADFPNLRYQCDELEHGNRLFVNEVYRFPHKYPVTISDTGSFHNMLTHTDCFFIGIYNEHAYKETGFYDNLRTLKVLDKSFTFDTIWICRKNWVPDELSTIFLTRLFATANYKQFSYESPL